MEAATVEQSSGDTSPVFVAGGRHRNHAVRLAAASLGLLLVGWLTAIAAGLIGFSSLPELTRPDTGAARTPAVALEEAPKPAGKRDAGIRVLPVSAHPHPARDGGQVSTDASAGPGSAPAASGSTAEVAEGQAPVAATGSTSPDSGAEAPQTPAPSGGPASSAHAPSFTPPASGEKSASPPRGNSADAPGSAVSADPPGGGARPRSG